MLSHTSCHVRGNAHSSRKPDPQKFAMFVAVAAVSSGLGVKSAQADTAIFGAAYALPEMKVFTAAESIDVTTPLAVPQFNSSWGTLSSVNVNISLSITGLYAEYLDGTADWWWGLSCYSVDPELTNQAGPTSPAIWAANGDHVSAVQVIHYYDDETTATPYEQLQSTSAFVGSGTFNFTIEDNMIVTFDPDDGSDTLLVLHGYAQVHPEIEYDFTLGTTPNPNLVTGNNSSSGSGSAPATVVASNGQIHFSGSGNMTYDSIDNWGTITLSSGIMTVTNNFNQNLNYVGGSQQGTFSISGNGTATFGSLTGNGEVSISGGNLTVGDVDHKGVISQTGGTFSASNFTQSGSLYLDLSNNVIEGGAFALSSSGNASLGNVTNNGIMTQSGGTLTATSFTQTASSVIDAVGTTHHFGTYTLTGGNASLGAVFGNGTITTSSGTSFTAAKLSMPTGNVAINGNAAFSHTSAARQTSDVAVEIGNLSVGTASAYIDLTNHDMIIHGGVSLSDVRSLLSAGRGSSGNWSGILGISSSDANANGLALGYAEVNEFTGNNTITTFDGITVSSTDILVKYTYPGDANLDGMVDIKDEQIWASNFSGDWAHGDFNYDGSVNIIDLQTISNHWQDGVGSPPTFLLRVPTGNNVPEPASLVLLSAGAFAKFSRRKRPNHR